MRYIKKENGITLVSLVITIIILLILATISINWGKTSLTQSEDNKLQAELEMVHHAVLETYTKHKTQAQVVEQKLPGDIIANINNESDIPIDIKQNMSGTYYKLSEKDQFEKIGMKNVKDTYIVNYETGEVFNLTTNTKSDKTVLYIAGVSNENDSEIATIKSKFETSIIGNEVNINININKEENTVTIPNLEIADKEFYKWNTSKDGTGTYYTPNDKISIDVINSIDKLYPIFLTNWTQPVLTSNTSYGTVTCSSNYGSHYAYYAFDGKVAEGNKWLSNGTANGWLKWKLEKKIFIKSFELYGTGESSYANRSPKTIKLYGSNDDENWTELATIENTKNLVNDYVEVNVNNPEMFEYYKWDFPNGNLGGGYGIAVGNIEIIAKQISENQ